VQCPNLKGVKADDFTVKTKTAFVQAATLLVGASNLYKDTVPHCSQPFNLAWKGGQMQREDGLAKIPLGKVEAVLRRSGLHDMVFDVVGDMRDLFDFYNLAPATTIIQARGHASTLKDLAFGITMRRNGYAIRIKHGTRAQVDQQLKPELHKAMGDSLAALPRSEGCRLMLRGVPSSYNDDDIIANI
jgi:hypothetical protein